MSYYLVTGKKKVRESSLDKITLYRSENVYHFFPPSHPFFPSEQVRLKLFLMVLLPKIISRNTLDACFRVKEKEKMSHPTRETTEEVWDAGFSNAFLLLQDRLMLCLRHERLMLSLHLSSQPCCLHLSRCPPLLH